MVLKCLNEEVAEDKEKIFISYTKGVEKEKIEKVFSDMTENGNQRVYTVSPDTPASTELEKELEGMDTIAVITSREQYTTAPTRTMDFDIPFAIKHDKGMTSIVKKEENWLYELEAKFFELMAVWYTEEPTEQTILKAKAGALGHLLSECEKSVPANMTVPLAKARLEITEKVADAEPVYQTKLVRMWAVLNYGHAVGRTRDYETAARYIEDAYSLAMELKEEKSTWDTFFCIVRSSALLGSIASEKDDVRRMKRWYRRAIENAKEMHDNKDWKGAEEFASVDMYYTDALLHMSAISEREGALKDALEYLFQADLTLKEHPEFVSKEALAKIGERIDELAAHVLSGMEQ